MQLAVAERWVTSRARTATAVDQPLRRIGRSARAAPLDIREGVDRGIERLCLALANRKSSWRVPVEAALPQGFCATRGAGLRWVGSPALVAQWIEHLTT